MKHEKFTIIYLMDFSNITYISLWLFGDVNVDFINC